MTRVDRVVSLLEQAIHAGDSPRAVEVVEGAELTRGERSAICRALQSSAWQERLEAGPVRIVFGQWDMARVEEVTLQT